MDCVREGERKKGGGEISGGPGCRFTISSVCLSRLNYNFAVYDFSL